MMVGSDVYISYWKYSPFNFGDMDIRWFSGGVNSLGNFSQVGSNAAVDGGSSRGAVDLFFRLETHGKNHQFNRQKPRKQYMSHEKKPLLLSIILVGLQGSL